VLLLATATLSVLAPGVVGTVLVELVDVAADVSEELDDSSGSSPSAKAHPPIPTTITAAAATAPARRLNGNGGSFTEASGTNEVEQPLWKDVLGDPRSSTPPAS
jgi:hypothetical protein